MPKRTKIPDYVKLIVRRSLRKRIKQKRQRQASLTKEEAKKLGIQSGVERAKQLARNKYVYESDAKSMIAFYNRFKNFKSPKVEDAINLWGGRSYLRFLKKIYNK